MNVKRIAALATVMSTGCAAWAADVVPAWTEDNFVMEEIVVTAEAPPTYYMEEIVVTATLPELGTRSEDNTAAMAEQSPNTVMEEIVVTASLDDRLMRIAAWLRNRRDARHF